MRPNLNRHSIPRSRITTSRLTLWMPINQLFCKFLTNSYYRRCWAQWLNINIFVCPMWCRFVTLMTVYCSPHARACFESLNYTCTVVVWLWLWLWYCLSVFKSYRIELDIIAFLCCMLSKALLLFRLLPMRWSKRAILNVNCTLWPRRDLNYAHKTPTGKDLVDIKNSKTEHFW